MIRTPSVAVITTTIGRDSLRKAIESIKAQTYPCKHYVFVDGQKYWDKVQPIMQEYPEVTFSLLGMNTGRNKYTNGAIHAILPYLLDEDVFCFLDDDNWHDENHVAELVTLIDQHQLDYAYSLRRIYSQKNEFLCDDNFESIGFWQLANPIYAETNGKGLSINNGRLIDTNCYAITRDMSFQLVDNWFVEHINDRAVFNRLLSVNAKGGCTGKRTTNYKWDLTMNGFSYTELVHIFRQFHQVNIQLPWLTPTLLINNQLTPC